MTDLHDLITRMADELDHYRQLLTDDRREVHALAMEARAALAEPESRGPTVMEIIELADETEESGLGQIDLVRAALARWGRPADLLEQCRATPNHTRELLIMLSSHMAYMQGQLEAFTQQSDHETSYWYRQSVALRQKVIDALAEGREPASVDGEHSDEEGPSAEEVEELCEEHGFIVEGYESIECLQGLINEAIARWGRPAPVPCDKSSTPGDQ